MHVRGPIVMPLKHPGGTMQKDNLNGVLSADETPLWQGRPQIDVPWKSGQALGFYVILACGTILMWETSTSNNASTYKTAIFALLWLFVIASNFHSTFGDAVRRSCSQYVLTPKRALIVTHWPFFGARVAQYPIATMTELSVTGRNLSNIVFKREAGRSFFSMGDQAIGFERLENVQEVVDQIRDVKNANNR